MQCFICKVSFHALIPAVQTGNPHRLLQCEGCGVIRVETFPGVETLKSEYTDSYLPTLEAHSRLLRWLKRNLIIRPEVRWIKNYLHTEGIGLDIGCGTGWATAVWRDLSGMKIHGLESQPEWAGIASSRYGLKVFQGSIEETEIPDPVYDLVILRHVLEHVRDPLGVLLKVHRMLKPGGMILLIVPNADGVGRKIFGPYWAWDIPKHLYWFSPKNLVRLLSNCGLSVMEVRHSPSPLLLASSFNNLFSSRGRTRMARYCHEGSVMANCFLFPLSLAGKIFRRSEVITVLARKLFDPNAHTLK